jgi:hypothetical protein
MTRRAGLLWLFAFVLAGALAYWDYAHHSGPRPRRHDEDGASAPSAEDEAWVEVEVEGE